MDYNQIYSLSTGSIISTKDGKHQYVYVGVKTDDMYFFSEIPQDEESEPEDRTITRAELLSGYIKLG